MSEEPKSDTPETDEITLKHWGDGFAAKHLKPHMQKLERERDAARRLAEEWKDYALWSSHRQPKPTILPWGNNQPERE